MRALRVVGLTEDGEVVLEDPVRLERFRVPADERLRAAARGDLSRLGQIAIELESQLRPREIQARIRAGASVEQVAAAAGVPEQKIERFAYPVLLERFRTAENAQRAHPVRADGPDNRTLAEVVAHTFGLRGQAYEGARWDSWKGEDGRWVVALGWRAGRSDNHAHWTFQPGAHGGTVTALDEHASDLVEGLPARPLRTVGAVVDIARPEEEPPDTPSPVEQWRAAASDSYRERMPHVPEPARPSAERGTTRTAEPWRPVAPPPRQPEPAEARLAESRTGSTRGAPEPRYRSSEPAREPAPREPEPRESGNARPTGGAEPPRREPLVPEQARTERTRVDQQEPEPARSSVAGSEVAGSEVAATEVADSGGARSDAAGSDEARPAEDPAEQAVPEAPAVLEAPVPVSAAADVPEPDPAATGPRAAEPAVEVPEDAAALPAPPATATAPATAPVPPRGEATEVLPEAPAADPVPEDATETTPAARRRTKKGKPAMPSWDEVLLGVRGPR